MDTKNLTAAHAKYVIVNRTNSDTWSFQEKDRAKAFLRFVINDFLSQRDKNDSTMERLYAGDFIITQYGDNGKQIGRWIGLSFFES